MSRLIGVAELPIDLDVRGGVPLHRALYDALRDAILRGRIGPGARLPSSRDLADQLAIGRGTVVAVYDQLAGEGYLAARTGSGTVVAAQLPDRWTAPGPAARARKRAPLSRWARALEEAPSTAPFETMARRNPRPFRSHIPAVDAFPLETWSRLLARRARRDESLFLSDTDVRGYRPLREVLAAHLRVARGVVCSADQIVIVPSVQQVIDLVTRLTVDPGEEIWMEDPGYRGARAVFESLDVKIVPVPVDGEGIDVAEGIRRAPRARLAFVTPGHQAPLGVTATIDRRAALLEWAAAQGAFVLEDDYDSEYRYEGRPVPALQGLDRAGVVVHTGTFSKTLLPSLRLAYAVLPDALHDRFLEAKSIVDRYTPPLSQAVLCDFIEGGHFVRHLRRMREIYAERRGALLDALTSELGGTLEILGASAGLELVARLPAGWSDVAASEALASAPVPIETLALSHHAIEAQGLSGLVLGFAAFSPSRLKKSVTLMRAALRKR